jgi:hypothetical protein
VLSFAGAAEANPLMARFLSKGLGAFVLVKVTLVVGPLAILEWARRYRPALANRALSLALYAYLGFYLLGVARVNLVPYPSRGEASLKKTRIVWAQIQERIREKRMRQEMEGAPVNPSSPESAVAPPGLI